MKVLILGGTQFVGRHVAETLLSGGHSVSILTRGKSPDALSAEVERLRGDRDEGALGLQALQGRHWDVCVDVSGYTPRQVRPSVEQLRTNVNRYVFVSAVRVYGDPKDRPVRETHSRMRPAHEDVTEVNDETYGALKVTCENIVQQAYAERCTLLRPQVVVGPYDPIDRLSYWVRRAMLGGEMLAPGDGSDHVQFIDAHDFARFTRTVIENDVSGAFNLAGTRLKWVEFMTVLGAQDLVWVNAEIIKSAGLKINELPLYRPERGALSGLMDVNNERAIRAGLSVTDPAVTIQKTRDWLISSDLAPALSPEREAELIRIARHAAVLSQLTGE
jgi:2'-hydroxyisoflavone reductase